MTEELEQENAAAELVRQRARFETALSNISDGVIVTDAEALVTFMNPAAERFTGWTRKEGLHKPLAAVFNIVDEHLRTPIESPVTRALRDGPIIGLAGLSILLARDGTQWAIDDSAAPIVDNAGTAIGVVVIFHNITTRRRAQQRREVSEVRYRRLFETAHDGILILDANTGRVLDVNRFLLDLLQYPIEYFLGKELWEIGVLHDIDANKAAMASLKEQGRIRYEDLPLESKSGLCIPVEFVSNVYSEGDHNVIQCNIRDITERRRTELELKEVKLAAEAANRAKSQFLANMSHEIRTPMTAIMGFADMILHSKQTDDERAECVRVIRRNGTHLLELINGILDLSKIEEGLMTVEAIPCDVMALLADIAEVVRARATEKGLDFKLIATCPIPRIIRTDPLRLRQILVNLLDNAIKFTPAGTVTMTMCTDGSAPTHMLRIEVIDCGIGMLSEQIERLFRPFAQADGSITRKFGGTGLGLTISRQLARLLGGDIEVKSTFGVGSTFILRVDGGSFAGVEMLTELSESKLPSATPADKWQNVSLHGRILLAEDGLDNQRLLGTHLRTCGAEVVVAGNGQIAVDLVAKGSFDLILMDMQMPVMDGYTATAELRRTGCQTAIIALTAYAMAEDREKCKAAGCTDYLSKPIDRNVLLTTVSEYLKQAHVQKRLIPSVKNTAVGATPKITDPAASIKSSLAEIPEMTELIAEFVGGLPGEVRKMTEFLQQSDMASLRRTVHQLRGAGGGYGFSPITDSAVSAEGSIDASSAPESIAANIGTLIGVVRRVEGYDEKKHSS
jgi:PAS domain S-box-containing protein